MNDQVLLVIDLAGQPRTGLAARGDTALYFACVLDGETGAFGERYILWAVNATDRDHLLALWSEIGSDPAGWQEEGRKAPIQAVSSVLARIASDDPVGRRLGKFNRKGDGWTVSWSIER